MPFKILQERGTGRVLLKRGAAHQIGFLGKFNFWYFKFSDNFSEYYIKLGSYFSKHCDFIVYSLKSIWNNYYYVYSEFLCLYSQYYFNYRPLKRQCNLRKNASTEPNCKYYILSVYVILDLLSLLLTYFYIISLF